MPYDTLEMRKIKIMLVLLEEKNWWLTLDLQLSRSIGVVVG